jgi:hypothetical protein
MLPLFVPITDSVIHGTRYDFLNRLVGLRRYCPSLFCVALASVLLAVAHWLPLKKKKQRR